VIRTIISLDEDDKSWLAKQARHEHTSEAALLRRLVRRYREENESSLAAADSLLNETSGIWRLGDGLEYQSRLRAEW
jgi:hypothetical protein